MTEAGLREVRLGDRRFEIVVPRVGDPRLHVAAVIISIHVIGITALGFRVSVPQILSAVLPAAVIDIAVDYRQTGRVAWPASAMLTGSGVALILRVVGMESDELWTWQGWHYFAVVAVVSVLSKYLVRYRGTHIFNPSNIGLVAAFLVFGSGVMEPLDFWWAPLGPWMGLAYLVILVGGVMITARLDLLPTAVAFWVSLVAGLSVLSASGHCMIATWSFTPVCGSRFWWTLATSPEILVFLFFMLTDPRTIPLGRAARVAFGATLGVVAVLLIAPQTVEFGAKVGLLGSLAILNPFRGMFDRLLPETEVGRDAGIRWFRLDSGHRLAGCLAGLVLAGSGIVVAGLPARAPAAAVTSEGHLTIDLDVDPSTLPPVSMDPAVYQLNSDLDAADAQAIAINLAENLEIEKQAILRTDSELLAAGSFGTRAEEIQERIDRAIAKGEFSVWEYSFDSLKLRVVEEGQTRAALGFDAQGTRTEITYQSTDAEQSRTTTRFSSTFVVRRLGGDRWLLVDVINEVGRSS